MYSPQDHKLGSSKLSYLIGSVRLVSSAKNSLHFFVKPLTETPTAAMTLSLLLYGAPTN